MVEMLIAVAIVAILAAIAVPSFGWVIAKSRQVEAKTNLAGIRGLEATYHVENRAFGNIADIGFVPDGSNRYGYCAGDPRAAGSCIDSATDAIDFAAGAGRFGSGGGHHWHMFCSKPPCSDPPIPPAPPPPKPGATPMGGGNPHVAADDFEADAYGRISQSPPPHDFDSWSIDQNDSLTNYRVGY